MSDTNRIHLDALDHILRVARSSRTQSRRIRWIESRASAALEGRPYVAAEHEQPRRDGPNDLLRLSRKNAALRDLNQELQTALDDLLTDMLIAQGNMRDAAKHDPRWEGCAEAIQPRVDAARAAIAKARGES